MLEALKSCGATPAVCRWAWNANSADTGGIVGNGPPDDWTNIQFEKTDFLRTIGLVPLYASSTFGVPDPSAAAVQHTASASCKNGNCPVVAT